MSEAIGATVDHAFGVLGFHSIEAIIDPANLASRRVLEKNGFEREAWFKEDFFWNGRFHDTQVYSILDRQDQHRAKTSYEISPPHVRPQGSDGRSVLEEAILRK